MPSSTTVTVRSPLLACVRTHACKHTSIDHSFGMVERAAPWLGAVVVAAPSSLVSARITHPGSDSASPPDCDVVPPPPPPPPPPLLASMSRACAWSSSLVAVSSGGDAPSEVEATLPRKSSGPSYVTETERQQRASSGKSNGNGNGNSGPSGSTRTGR